MRCYSVMHCSIEVFRPGYGGSGKLVSAIDVAGAGCVEETCTVLQICGNKVSLILLDKDNTNIVMTLITFVFDVDSIGALYNFDSEP